VHEGLLFSGDTQSREKYGEAGEESKKARKRQKGGTNFTPENGALKPLLF
jgi:hypothetical protein